MTDLYVEVENPISQNRSLIKKLETDLVTDFGLYMHLIAFTKSVTKLYLVTYFSTTNFAH